MVRIDFLSWALIIMLVFFLIALVLVSMGRVK